MSDVERRIHASHHVGPCRYLRYCVTHETPLTGNSRESVDAHIRARRHDDRSCKFEFRCTAGGKR